MILNKTTKRMKRDLKIKLDSIEKEEEEEERVPIEFDLREKRLKGAKANWTENHDRGEKVFCFLWMWRRRFGIKGIKISCRRTGSKEEQIVKKKKRIVCWKSFRERNEAVDFVDDDYDHKDDEDAYVWLEGECKWNWEDEQKIKLKDDDDDDGRNCWLLLS